MTSNEAAGTTATPREQRRLPVADVVLTAALLAMFVVAFVTARGWPFETGIFPQMVTALGAGLALLHLVVLLVRRPAAETRPAGEDTEIEAVDVEYVFEHAGLPLWLRSLGWLAGFFVALYLLGIFVTAPVFTVLYLRFSARASWLLSVVYAVVVGALLYLSFVVFLDLPTPEGILL
ncbi:MAG: tripartite tricarboxylate transporter TctB family protein [Actinomycetota bacterium]|nr:tripartite tricarboxylate transporter TctB family protein [Actinomycetota bacterium]